MSHPTPDNEAVPILPCGVGRVWAGQWRRPMAEMTPAERIDRVLAHHGRSDPTCQEIQARLIDIRRTVRDPAQAVAAEIDVLRDALASMMGQHIVLMDAAAEVFPVWGAPR